MDPLLGLGERRGILIVEDAAQAIGATDNGRRAGSMGVIGCFSFYPTKNLGGAGDGGILTTNDDTTAATLATTARARRCQPSISTKKWASTAGWTNCRQQCCASSFRVWINGPTSGRRKAARLFAAA